MEEGEDLLTALARELREEAGVEIKVRVDVGIAVEYRTQHGMMQFSYCYYGTVSGDAGGTAYTDEEQEAGFRLLWVRLEDAIAIMERDCPIDYVGRLSAAGI